MPKDHELSPHRFHSDLFLSGVDRILLIARKASTTYYPTLHLEIARYIASATKAGYELPWSITKYIGPPPSAMCKPGCGRTATSAQAVSVRSHARSQSHGTQATSRTSQATNVSSRPQVQGPRERSNGTGLPTAGSSPQLPPSRKVTPMFG